MKVPIFVFIFLLGSSAWAQRITNVFVDLGMNHSGIIYSNDLFFYLARNDFKKHFNPNFNASAGLEIKLKNRLNLMPSIGLRNSGTKYDILVTTAQYPDGTPSNIVYKFQQITLPLTIGYNFGKQFQIKPLIGIVNNYNLKTFAISSYDDYSFSVSDYKKYYLNFIGGVMFSHTTLFNSKLGLGLKITYEKSLMDLDHYSKMTSSQNIVNASLMLIYKLPSKN